MNRPPWRSARLAEEVERLARVGVDAEVRRHRIERKRASLATALERTCHRPCEVGRAEQQGRSLTDLDRADVTAIALRTFDATLILVRTTIVESIVSGGTLRLRQVGLPRLAVVSECS